MSTPERRSRRRPRLPPRIEALQSTDRTVELRGGRIPEVLNLAGCPRQFSYNPPSGDSECWLIPAYALADIVAAAETKRGSVQVVDTPMLFEMPA